jgi:hypothetical protein
MNRLLWISLLTLLPLSGCGYFQDRLKDASEVIEVGLGLSPGVEANARVTKVFQVGFGSYSGHWVGLREGHLAYWTEERSEMGFSLLYFHELTRTSRTLVDFRHPLPTESGYSTYMADMNLITDRGFFEIGLTGNLVLVGFDVAFEAAEFFDFLFGLVGVDILHDDCYSKPLDELVTQAQSRNAYRRAAAIRGLRRVTGKEFGYEIVTARDEHPRDQIRVWQRWKEWLDGTTVTEDTE